MTIYRRIYERAIGPIPIDKNGITFDIHHIDGNHSNNNISNLMALSIQEHYDIHLAQGDIGACRAIRLRMETGQKDKEILSELSKKVQKERVENGTHNFLKDGFHSDIQRKRVEDGTHNFLREGFQKEIQNKLIEEGKHHLLGGKYQAKQLAEGKHPSQVVRTCPHCGKVGKGGGMMLKHFDNCKWRGQ